MAVNPVPVDDRPPLPAPIAAAWELARAFWPTAKAPQSDETARAWSIPLREWTEHELCTALMAMAAEHQHFPSLADLVSHLRGQRQAERVRTAPPLLPEAVADVATPKDVLRLQLDRGATEWEGEKRAEAVAYARDAGWSDERLAARIAAIEDRSGPFSARLRETLLRDEPRPLDAWWSAIKPRDEHPRPLAPVVTEPLPTLESRAAELAEAYWAGQPINPDDWAEDERAEARALIRHRKTTGGPK